MKRWQAKNTLAVNAKAAVHAALARGVIAKPKRCQVRNCRQRGRLEAHHFDYDHPLQVLWLCRAHHNRLHTGDRLDLVVGLPPVLASTPENQKENRK